MMVTGSRMKKRNLYRSVFKRNFERCIKSITKKAQKQRIGENNLNTLVENGFIEIKRILSGDKNDSSSNQPKGNILLIKQKKEINRTPAIWIAFDKNFKFKELRYQLEPSIKQTEYIFIIARHPLTKNQFIAKLLLGANSQLTMYTINDFAPTVDSYKVTLEISLQKGATFKYNAFTTSAPKSFESTITLHGGKDTLVNYNSHFCNTNYYTTHHRWALSRNSKIDISINGITGAQSALELNDEFICTDSKSEISFKTHILKVSPLARVQVNPTISIGSTASYTENIKISHIKREHYDYLARLSFGKEETLDLLTYSYLNLTSLLEGRELCSQFLILL